MYSLCRFSLAKARTQSGGITEAGKKERERELKERRPTLVTTAKRKESRKSKREQGSKREVKDSRECQRERKEQGREQVKTEMSRGRRKQKFFFLFGTMWPTCNDVQHFPGDHGNREWWRGGGKCQRGFETHQLPYKLPQLSNTAVYSRNQSLTEESCLWIKRKKWCIVCSTGNEQFPLV